MERGAAGTTDRAQFRLAELVAALSLGIDLGFGQPMEHVLRQCLIALKLAERLGLDEQQRPAATTPRPSRRSSAPRAIGCLVAARGTRA